MFKRFSVYVNGNYAGKIGATSEAEATTVFRIFHSSQVSGTDILTARKD